MSTKEWMIRPSPQSKKYRFFSTGSPELLIKGFDVDLDMTFTPEKCKHFLLSEITKHIKIKKGDLLIYVSGGIPFLHGTLGDIYLKHGDPKIKPYIYGIITSLLPNIDIDNTYYELCNINDDTRKTILSPLSDSTNSGFCNIACLLGYLNHDGNNGDLFLRAVAAAIHFPPLITSLNRVIERNNITGRDIITISSTLYTYFKWMIPDPVKSENVFDYALKCSNILCQLKDIPESLPILTVEVKPGMAEGLEFLNHIYRSGTVYMWGEDMDKSFNYLNVSRPTMDDINSSYNKFSYFTPISPFSVRVATGCAIIRGKEHTFLYLKQSSSKDSKSDNSIDIIDPTTGFVDSVDLTTFSAVQDDHAGTMDLIDQEQIKQIIYVCLDTSKRMAKPICRNDDHYSNKKEIPSKSLATSQYLTIFANRLYGYRISCILGLITFNKTATIRSRPKPFVENFEEEGLKEFELSFYSNCTEALSLAYNELSKFTNYENATKRIVLIAAGNDLFSTEEGAEITKKLFQGKIVLDVVALGSEEDFHELIAMSHVTGGLSLNPTSISDGLSLFEKSAFLNINERELKYQSKPLIPNQATTRPSKLKVEMINNDFIEEISKYSRFDTEIINTEVHRAAINDHLSTPRLIVSLNRSTQHESRIRRILRELYYIEQVMNEKNSNYDPNLIVYTFTNRLDRWIVFLKGEEKTIYEGKWFQLYISFPDLYPSAPPVIRFMSIPYHLNISSEGRICLNMLDKGYMPSCRIVDIIQEVKEVFVLPDPSSPIQIEIYETFTTDVDLYYQNAKNSADEVGKKDFNKFFNKQPFIKDVDPTTDRASVDDEELLPVFMMSQIYGRPMRAPVLSSSGVYYDRDELIQILSSSRNPTCVVTGRRLTNNVNDI